MFFKFLFYYLFLFASVVFLLRGWGFSGSTENIIMTFELKQVVEVSSQRENDQHASAMKSDVYCDSCVRVGIRQVLGSKGNYAGTTRS